MIIVAGFLLLVFSPVLSCAQESQGRVRGSLSQTEISSPPAGSPLILAQKSSAKEAPFSHPAIQEGELCVSAKCHAEMGTAAYVHTPIAQGSCMYCHDVTASKARFGLKKPELDLCLSCHEDLYKDWKSVVQDEELQNAAKAGSPVGGRTKLIY